MEIRATVVDRQDLTAREAEILALICEGQPDKLIARELAISIKTVGAHLDRIYLKLQLRQASVNRRCAAISTAVSRGMVSVGVRTLGLILMVSVANWDDAATARHWRVRSLRARTVHVRAKEV